MKPPGATVPTDPAHLPLLEAVEGEKNVSQRTLGRRLDMATSRVNRLIHDLMEEGHLEVVDDGVRPFAYRLTDDGREYLRRLTWDRYRAVLRDFRRIQDRIARRLREIRDAGVRRVVFYGAGDIMDVTFPLAESLGLQVVGVVDDDPDKQGDERSGLPVAPPERLEELVPCAVVITTFRHADEIRSRLSDRIAAEAQVLQI